MVPTTVSKRSVDGRRLRAGIVGGGRGAFIGAIHRMAVELDGEALVVAGVMSSNAEVARESAADWYLDRSYDSYSQMALAEAQRIDGIDFVIIAAPNHMHYPVSKVFLEQGIPVVCDKPLTHTVKDGEALAELVRNSGQLFALTHCYTGYPMVREARERAKSGALGKIRKVLVEYHQDWLMETFQRGTNKQADWRTDPERSGGGKGLLSCSQVACGEENDLRIRVYGDRAGLEWHQQEPNTLLFKPARAPWERLRAGGKSLSAPSVEATRLPGGHPEGYLPVPTVFIGFQFSGSRPR